MMKTAANFRDESPSLGLGEGGREEGREGGRKREKEGVERGLEREQVGGCEVEE